LLVVGFWFLELRRRRDRCKGPSQTDNQKPTTNNAFPFYPPPAC
jgi:hypothetical protein